MQWWSKSALDKLLTTAAWLRHVSPFYFHEQVVITSKWYNTGTWSRWKSNRKSCGLSNFAITWMILMVTAAIYKKLAEGPHKVVCHPEANTICSSCVQNLKTVTSTILKIWSKTQNVNVGWLGVIRFTRGVLDVTVQHSAYHLPVTFQRNFVSIVYHFSDIVSCVTKVADLSYAMCISLGWTCRNFTKIFGTRKLESIGYHVVSVCMVMFSHFDKTPAFDGQVHRHRAVSYAALA